jgi:hypothetical protein
MVRLTCASGKTSESMLGWGLPTWILPQPTGKACFVGIKSGGAGSVTGDTSLKVSRGTLSLLSLVQGSCWVGLNEKWVSEGVQDTPNFWGSPDKIWGHTQYLPRPPVRSPQYDSVQVV